MGMCNNAVRLHGITSKRQFEIKRVLVDNFPTATVFMSRICSFWTETVLSSILADLTQPGMFRVRWKDVADASHSRHRRTKWNSKLVAGEEEEEEWYRQNTKCCQNNIFSFKARSVSLEKGKLIWNCTKYEQHACHEKTVSCPFFNDWKNSPANNLTWVSGNFNL